MKIVAAHQLKSGDIQIFTSSTAENTQLKQNKGWIRGLGERAELITPTYGVIVHGIPTNTINTKDQDATIQQILAENHTVIPSAKISYVGWLTRESTLKRASSIVLEFTEPEMANAVIYAGMVWDGQIHQCQLYDRACRIKQCFRCYNYGHIGTQCNAAQTCGYCADHHETKHCSQKGREDFSPRCAVCKDVHTAWSNACPARKKELARVEQAKQARKIYWHVPSRGSATKPRTDINTRSTSTFQEPGAITRTAVMVRARHTARRPTGMIEDVISEETDNPVAVGTQSGAAPTASEPQEPQEPQETATRAPSTPNTEDWADPAIHQEPTQPRIVSHQILSTEEIPSPTREPDEGQPLQYECQPADTEADPIVLDADTWLDNLAVDFGPQWIQPTLESQPTASPPTSLATDPRTANGTIYRGCKCPEHQEIYHDWPARDAELTIATCMKTCIYCGMDFTQASELRKHLRGMRYTRRRNLTVQQETRGKYSSSTPAWSPKPVHGSAGTQGQGDPTNSSRARITRSQSFTNSTIRVQHQ
jgi:hypothetical protein